MRFKSSWWFPRMMYAGLRLSNLKFIQFSALSITIVMLEGELLLLFIFARYSLLKTLSIPALRE